MVGDYAVIIVAGCLFTLVYCVFVFVDSVAVFDCVI